MGSDTPVDMSLPVYKSTSTDGVQETISRSPLTKVAAGFYAEVYLFDGADIVVKIPKANGQALHDIEKRIYERIESHPNILVFLGEHTAYLPDISGTYQLRKGLSFEYVPGGTLKELLVNTTDPAMMSMVRQRGPHQLASALAHVHSKGVIHGDVGVHNVLVRAHPDTSLLLCDFGGSRIDGSRCLAFPSSRYRRMAQTKEERHTYFPVEKDDIFSFGVVIFELVTCAILWQTMEKDQILQKISRCEWPEAIPADDWEATLLKSARKCWEGVYETVEQLISDLDHAG